VEQTFDIAEREVDGLPVVSVSGEIDVATAPGLRDRLHELLAAGRATIVVDLLAVTFLDSTALGVLVGVMKRCRAAGGDLRLVIDERRIIKVFEITGLADVFAIFPETAPALSG
jgi:anti-sigma B factor antagonist